MRALANTAESRACAEAARNEEAEGFRMLAREAWDLQNRYFADLAKVRRAQKVKQS